MLYCTLSAVWSCFLLKHYQLSSPRCRVNHRKTKPIPKSLCLPVEFLLQVFDTRVFYSTPRSLCSHDSNCLWTELYDISHLFLKRALVLFLTSFSWFYSQFCKSAWGVISVAMTNREQTSYPHLFLSSIQWLLWFL